jgi:hypothetical protein
VTNCTKRWYYELKLHYVCLEGKVGRRKWQGLERQEDLMIVIEIDMSSGIARPENEGMSTGMPLVHRVGLCFIRNTAQLICNFTHERKV